MKKQDRFLTVREIAEIIKVNVMTIYRYIKAKRIKAYKIGKGYRIDKTELEHFMDNVKTK